MFNKKKHNIQPVNLKNEKDVKPPSSVKLKINRVKFTIMIIE